MTDLGGGASSRPVRGRRRRVSMVSVFGELLLTAGALVLLYAAWQMWIGDWIMSAEANDKGHAISQAWARESAPPLPPVVDDGSGVAGSRPEFAPPVLNAPSDGELWGPIMRVPRWGQDYEVQLAGGVTRSATLDHGWIGVYPGSAMPGQTGNFSMAAHRTTWGKPFNQLDKLHVGDPIVIETRDGWYTYRFRTLEYVTPSSVDVLDPVPQEPGAQDGGRYITLTACSPLYSLAERIVAYGVFDGFQPRALGLPASLKGPVS